MTRQEYFGDWFNYLDMKALDVALQYVVRKGQFYPEADKVFRAFTLCKARDTKAVFLGQDPYPQKGVATGIAFGNSAETPENKLSPSLEVLKEAAIDYTMPHRVLTFDQTLESWAKQGVLLLNSSLTVKPGTPGSHSLYWRPFISEFLKKFSTSMGGVVFVLFGKQAQSFRNSISPYAGQIYLVEHPAALARRNEKLPSALFRDVNRCVHETSGEKIEWFHEEDYGQFSI